jgi:hypothetical protein
LRLKVHHLCKDKWWTIAPCYCLWRPCSSDVPSDDKKVSWTSHDSFCERVIITIDSVHRHGVTELLIIVWSSNNLFTKNPSHLGPSHQAATGERALPLNPFYSEMQLSPKSSANRLLSLQISLGGSVASMSLPATINNLLECRSIHIYNDRLISRQSHVFLIV